MPLIRSDLTAYKMRLRGICEEAIGAMSNRVEIEVASPKTAVDQMLRRLDRDVLRQLINLLQEAV